MMDIGEVLNLVIVVAIVLSVLGISYAEATSEQTQEAVERASEWCAERGGNIIFSRSVVHGGLHCEFKNGSIIHPPKDAVNMEVGE